MGTNEIHKAPSHSWSESFSDIKFNVHYIEFYVIIMLWSVV